MTMEIAALCLDGISDDCWEALYPLLSGDRRKKADAIRARERRRQSMAAGGLLEYLLKKNGVEEPFSYGATDWGRPFLRSPGGENMEEKGLFFSLSHTKDLAVCALSDQPVGVDAEKIRPGRQKIVQRYFTKREQEEMARGDSEEMFFCIWTRKEAWAKKKDLPLLKVLEKKDELDGYSLTLRKNADVITVCSDCPIGARTVDFISMEELLEGLKNH